MFHKSRAITPVILAILIFSTIIGSTLPALAFIPSHISVINPPVNGIVSSGFIMKGFFTSPNQVVNIIIDIDNANYTTTGSDGQWSYTTGIGDGTHDMKVYLFDSNGVTTTSETFSQVSGHVTPLKYGLIIPMYSEACQRMISMGDYSECPRLEQLIPYDTSNQQISGHFIKLKDGTWTRANPQVKNHYMFYNDMKTKAVCIECKADFNNPDTAQTILFEPTDFSYIKHDYKTTSTTNYQQNATGVSTYTSNTNEAYAGLVVYHQKYVDNSCNSANIVFSPQALKDTISYLQSGCTISLNDNTTTTKIPYHHISFNNPYSTQHLTSYYKTIFKGHTQLTNEKIATGGGLGPGNLINHKSTYTDPYKKVGY